MKYLTDLKNLSHYKFGWDGLDAKPLDKIVYQNVKTIIKYIPSNDFILVLRTNGIISILSKDNRCSVDVMRDHLSFSVITTERERLFQRYIEIKNKDNLITYINKIINLWKLV